MRILALCLNVLTRSFLRCLGIGIFLPTLAFGQLLVGTADGVIAHYSTGGQLIKNPFISIPGIPVAMAYKDPNSIFVSNYGENGSIGLYSKTGAPLNPNLINNLYYPYAIAVDGNNLFIASDPDKTISLYSTAGTLLNSQLITLPFSPYSIAADGNGHLYIGNGGRVSLYSTSGQLLNDSLVTNIYNPYAIALDGNGFMYVADAGRSVVGKYTTSGQVINDALISTGLSAPDSLALDGLGHLYVSSAWLGTVGVYNTDGTPINPTLIATGPSPLSLLFIPEPTAFSLLLLGGTAVALGQNRKRRAV